jgi:signal peptidase I
VTDAERDEDLSRGSSPEAERPSRGGARKAEPQRRPLPLWQEMGLLLGVALVLAVVIKAVFMQAFYIPSGSMNDTLVFNDRILVQKVSYWGGGEPERGDIVVFSDPGGWLDEAAAPQPGNPLVKGLEWVGLFPTGGHLVKRVIAVGGDTVQCCDRQGRVRVNGTPLGERDYLAPGTRPSLSTFKQKIPAGYLWVMGDNRPESADSRVHLGDPGGGCVPVDNVVGKVFAVVWPLGNVKLVQRPDTFDGVAAARDGSPESCG